MSVKSYPFVLFGIGGVGRAFLEQVLDCQQVHRQNFNLALCPLALCDSSGAVVARNANGLDNNALQKIMADKKAGTRMCNSKLEGADILAPSQGQSMSDFLKSVVESRVSFSKDHLNSAPVAVIDCTATDSTIPALLYAASAGQHVVSCNKKPFTSSMADFVTLTRVSEGGPLRRTVKYESTVGAGLPAIATVSRLLMDNDTILEINGAFSGTLSVVFSGLEAGGSLSSVVGDAFNKGYTEPDPRDDLSGSDVARKALILGRMMGIQKEMSDVKVEPLYPSTLSDVSVTDFLGRLVEADAVMAERVASAAQRGCVVRYAANIKGDNITVGVVEVSKDSALGRLAGTNNLLELRTRYYESLPLVVQGPGAGVEVTAGGVMSDLIELGSRI